MLKTQINIEDLPTRNYKVGDKVRLIDGSSLMFDDLNHYTTPLNSPIGPDDLYIVCAYPTVTKSSAPLKELAMNVVEVDCDNLCTCVRIGRNLSAFRQDIKIEYNGVVFRTASSMVAPYIPSYDANDKAVGFTTKI